MEIDPSASKPSNKLATKAQVLTSTATSLGSRRCALPLFFVAWTLFATGVAWWLIYSAGEDRIQPKLLFDSSQSAQIPVGEQIRRWLLIADLNFRGAYPWVLFAPYVIWLASCFLLERGRLRFSLPVHLAACALFAAASHILATHVVEKMNVVMVLKDRRQNTSLPAESVGTLANGDDEDPVRIHSYSSHVAGVKTEVVISTAGSVKAFELPPRINESDLMAEGFTTNRFITNRDSKNGTILATSPDKMIERFIGAPAVAGFSSMRSSWRYESRLFSNLLNVLAYCSLVGLAHAVYFYRRSRERERRAILLESNLAKARLHTLQAQLQPHFLFNALNAVATLLRSDARAAQEALTSFSELLRLALSQSEKKEVALIDDLRFVERYVEIQHTRLGDRFRYEQDVEPAALDCMVPALFLQPLVENALRHGIEPSSNPGLVRIIIKSQNDRLTIRVEDNGVGLSPSANKQKPGLGLSNLRERLQALYGDSQKMEFHSRPEGGVVVEIEIPLRAAL